MTLITHLLAAWCPAGGTCVKHGRQRVTIMVHLARPCSTSIASIAPSEASSTVRLGGRKKWDVADSYRTFYSTMQTLTADQMLLHNGGA